MNHLDAFKAEQWDAEECALAGEKALRYEIVTPRESVKCIVWEGTDGRLFHLSASNSYDERVAERIIDCVKAVTLSASQDPSIEVVAGNFEGVAKFNKVVIASPEVELFNHLSEQLQNSIYLVAPSYASEFSHGMSARDFRHQIGRKDGWRVYVYRWDRIEKTAPSWD